MPRLIALMDERAMTDIDEAEVVDTSRDVDEIQAIVDLHGFNLVAVAYTETPDGRLEKPTLLGRFTPTQQRTR